MSMKSTLILTLSFLIGNTFGQIRQEVKKESLKIFHGDKLITEYRTDHDFPYLYPLIGPSGNHLTRHFPMDKSHGNEQPDHPHHRSFWFTHGQVNGHDFWHSPDHDSRIVHESFSDQHEGSFTANLKWVHKEEVLLEEKRTYSFHIEQDQTMSIDVTSIFTAKTDVTFGDTKEGSFALRVTPTLRHEGKVAQGHLANSEGQKDGDVWGQRAKWISCYGPDSEKESVVISMMDHPDNLRHPTYWHARTYGLLAANPFGIKDFTKKGNGDLELKKGVSLTQRYRVLIQSGDFHRESVQKNYAEFAKRQ